jgi:hypothetical protein
MYQLRHRLFSYSDTRWFDPDDMFRDRITESAEFAFDMTDIVRIRSEKKTLVEKLSWVYLPGKKVQDRKEIEEKVAKAVARKAKTAKAVESKDADAEQGSNTEVDDNAISATDRLYEKVVRENGGGLLTDDDKT